MISVSLLDTATRLADENRVELAMIYGFLTFKPDRTGTLDSLARGHVEGLVCWRRNPIPRFNVEGREHEQT